MKILHETKTFESVASKGNRKFWKGLVIEHEGGVATMTHAWQEIGDGSTSKVLESTPKVIKGKNIGKANETTPLEQAISEIESEAAKKCDKGYWPLGEARPESLPLPMLAHSFDKRGHDIKWPAFVQPKLDGIRCLSDGKRFWTRLGKDFPADCVRHLQMELPAGVILDGELMLPPDRWSFQDTVSAAKAYNENSPYLTYYVYDIVDPSASFAERHERLRKLLGGAHFALVELVETTTVKNEVELHAMHDAYVAQGHEGLMVRNGDGLYKVKDRSKDLQKVKRFVDEEFEIVEVLEGEAKDAGTAVFVCVTADKKTFRVRPRGTVAQRSRYWTERGSLIGKSLTVRYQNMTDSGVPRFPIGIEIRNYE